MFVFVSSVFSSDYGFCLFCANVSREKEGSKNEPAISEGCKLVTCALLMRIRYQMTHWWYDKLVEGKLGKRARILDAKYELLASFLLIFGHLPAFRNSKKTQVDLFFKPASNFRQRPLFPVIRKKFSTRSILCPQDNSSSVSLYLFILRLFHLTAFDNHHASFRCRGRDA